VPDFVPTLRIEELPVITHPLVVGDCKPLIRTVFGKPKLSLATALNH